MADQALRLGRPRAGTDAAGLKLVGGRLLPGPTGPASFLMYESASGERFTIYTAKSEAEATQMRYAAHGNESALFWADRGVGYVVSGGNDRGRLTQDRPSRLRPDGEERRLIARPEIAVAAGNQRGVTLAGCHIGHRTQLSVLWKTTRDELGHRVCPNSDIENLESNHRRVSL